MKCWVVGFLLLFILPLNFGCSHQITPKRYSFPESTLPTLSVKTPIRIKAHLTNEQPVTICAPFIHSYKVTMDALTEDALATLADTFTRKNVPMESSARKQIEISIIGAECDLEAFTFNYKVKLRALLGNSTSKEFTGSQRTANHYTTNSTISDATTYAVIEMLKDSDVLTYLQGNNASRLIELKDLYNSGLITKDEYELKRSKLMDGL